MNAPKISTIELSELNPAKFSVIAIPVKSLSINSERTVISTQFTKSVEKYIERPLSELLDLWPAFTAKSGELVEYPLKNIHLYFIGVGENSVEDSRKAAIALARKVKGSSVSVLDLLVTEKPSARNHVVALTLASYSWIKKELSSFTLPSTYKSEIDLGNLYATGTWQARDLIHTPSNIKNPLWMANQAKSLIKKSNSNDLTITVKSGSALKEFGGLRAVGNSAPTPGPRFIEIKYEPRGSKKSPHVVLVGKGITFDTGGVSLKRPYESMVGMKSDMAGAAAVLATLLNVAAIGDLNVRVTGLLMCAENSLSATAQRPSDVITQYGGTTVEIINTDAEGRLVLADGLAYADLNLNPDYLIDIATLTGAATLGLGRQYGAMFTRNEKLAKELSNAGAEVSERLWHMPLIDDYKVALASEVADLNHTAEKPDFSGGSVTAALFLENFVGKRNWVHLDIAGPARSENDSGENPKGGTGFGVRVLTRWLTSL